MNNKKMPAMLKFKSECAGYQTLLKMYIREGLIRAPPRRLPAR